MIERQTHIILPSNNHISTVKREIVDIMYAEEGKCHIYEKPFRRCGSTTAIMEYVCNRLIHEDQYRGYIVFPHESFVRFFREKINNTFEILKGVPTFHSIKYENKEIHFISCKYDSEFNISSSFTGLTPSIDTFITDVPVPKTERQHEQFDLLLNNVRLLTKRRIFVEMYYT